MSDKTALFHTYKSLLNFDLEFCIHNKNYDKLFLLESQIKLST